MPIRDELRQRVVRVLLSFATAAAVSATAYICAWQQFRNSSLFGFSQEVTRMNMENLRQDIDNYQKTTGKLPATLADLDQAKAPDDTYRKNDAWGRPIQYQVEGDGYQLFSYGRDGQPGGEGLDADLYAGQVNRLLEAPTLWQFTAELDTMAIQAVCLLAGVVAFPICLVAGLGFRGSRLPLGMVLIANGLTAVFAILAAVAMSALHAISSGH